MSEDDTDIVLLPGPETEEAALAGVDHDLEEGARVPATPPAGKEHKDKGKGKRSSSGGSGKHGPASTSSKKVCK